jgi:hypothetical protein
MPVLSHPNDGGKEFSFRLGKLDRIYLTENIAENRLGESSWSKVTPPFLKLISKSTHHDPQNISLDAPAAETELTIVSGNTQEVHIGLSWTEGLGKYKCSKIITLAPRFFIKNGLDEAIVFREHGGSPTGRSTIEPGQRATIFAMRPGFEKLLTFAFPGLDAQWYVLAF